MNIPQLVLSYLQMKQSVETLVIAKICRTWLFTTYLKMDYTSVYLLNKQFLCQANDVLPSPLLFAQSTGQYILIVTKRRNPRSAKTRQFDCFSLPLPISSSRPLSSFSSCLHTVLHVSDILWPDCCLETVWFLKFLRPANSTNIFDVIFKKKRFNIPQVPCYSDSSVRIATQLQSGWSVFESLWRGQKFFCSQKSSQKRPEHVRGRPVSIFGRYLEIFSGDKLGRGLKLTTSIGCPV